MNWRTPVLITGLVALLIFGCIQPSGEPTPTPIIPPTPYPISSPLITPTQTPSITPVPTPTVAPVITPVPTPTIRPTPLSAHCGDGVCDDFERMHNVCPQDCHATSSTPQPTPTPSQLGTGVLYISVMVHVEGWNDTSNHSVFLRHLETVEQNAVIFERHGGKLTIEPGREYMLACKRWNSSCLTDLIARGHGIGIHADAGESPGETQASFTNDLRVLKADAESLGVNARHVSGICSPLDWVKAAEDSGYEFTTGGVAYCLKSLPNSKIPPEYSYVTACNTPAACHDAVPSTIEARLHPWHMASGANWLEHADHGPVYFASSEGLKCMDEDLTNSTHGGSSCTLTTADIPLLKKDLDDALSLTDPQQVNIYYVSWSIGSSVNAMALEEWLDAIDPYVASGRVKWKTIPEMYDAYVDWETTH